MPDPSAAEDGEGRRLVVYVPDVLGGSERWAALVERLETDPAFSDTDFHMWPQAGSKKPLRPWRRGHLDTYVNQMSAFVASLVRKSEREGRSYLRITLVGASIGGLLAREAWLRGLGQDEGDPAGWGSRVDRFVLAASINRGFDPKRLGPLRLVLPLLAPIRMAYRDALVGSSFVTNLRVRWIRMMGQIPNPPHVVQLLGDQDGVVTRDDSVDIEQFPNAAHVTLTGVSHADVLSIDGPDGDLRFMDIRDALLGTTPETEPPPDEEDLDGDVVFVLHGIRAGVFGWVRDVTARINALPGWKAIRPSYGFFSALEFALPTFRARKVRWFLDRYTKELARNPGANFHFVGHSNGTYALGYGLRRIRGMQFLRVYVAGSVLPPDFPWVEMREAGQVGLVRSDRGNRDIPVAILANGLRGFGMRDLGAGGFAGFFELDDPAWGTQWPYFPGGHGEPLKETRRAGVVSWITGSDLAQPDDLVDSSGGLIAAISRMAPVLVPVVILLLVGALLAPLFGGWSAVKVGAFIAAVVVLVASAVF